MNYYFSKKLNISFEEAIDKVKKELSKEGFGILIASMKAVENPKVYNIAKKVQNKLKSVISKI